MAGFVKFIAAALFVGCSFCFAQKSIAQKQSEWFSEFATADCDINIGSTFNTSFSPEEYEVYSGAFPADSLNAPLLIGTVKKETPPTIDEKYFVYNPPENEDVHKEKSERPKTIPAGFHNPTLVVSPESRKNIDDKMEKVGKGLCYASIATFILSGGGDTRLCGY